MSVSSLTASRINGLSSGLDTESLVKSMLQYDQAKVDKQFQAKTKLEWKRDAYREINTTLKNFRQSYMSVLNQSSNMLSTAAYNTFKVTMLDTTNAVTISAGASANTGKMTINQISQLATSATANSSGAISDTTINYNTALSDLNFTNAMTFEDDEISFTINGKEFTFGSGDSLSKVMSTINSDSDAGVKISYSTLKQGFTITSKTTGANSEVEIVNLKGNAFASTNSAFGIAQDTYYGQNAKLTIENVAVERDSNTFTIDGITYSLNDETDSEVSFNIERDLDSTVSQITNFINAYNDLIGTLQAKIDESVNRDYPPLTDAQRDEMTDDEVKKWEEKSMSGILRNDSSISSMLTSLRSAFYSKVSGTGMSGVDIGLTTGTWTEKGKIMIDETKLRTALENNPDAVTGFFTNVSSSTDSTTKFNESGLITRISTMMSNYTSQVTSFSLSTLDMNIRSAADVLSDLESQMSDDEERYWSKMTAMETALSSLNSQSSWMAAQLSGMSLS